MTREYTCVSQTVDLAHAQIHFTPPHFTLAVATTLQKTYTYVYD